MSGSPRYPPFHEQLRGALRAVLDRVRAADLVTVWRVRGNHQVCWECIGHGQVIGPVQQMVITAPLRGATPELSWSDVEVLLGLLTEISDLPLLGYRAAGDPIAAAVIEVAVANDCDVQVSSPVLEVKSFVEGIDLAVVQNWWPPPSEDPPPAT